MNSNNSEITSTNIEITAELDQTKSEAFAGKVLDILNAPAHRANSPG